MFLATMGDTAYFPFDPIRTINVKIINISTNTSIHVKFLHLSVLDMAFGVFAFYYNRTVS